MACFHSQIGIGQGEVTIGDKVDHRRGGVDVAAVECQLIHRVEEVDQARGGVQFHHAVGGVVVVGLFALTVEIKQDVGTWR